MIFRQGIYKEIQQKDINKKTILDMDSYIHELTGLNNKILKTKRINAMTISDITQIPRTTVIRKLQELIEMKFWLLININCIIYPVWELK